jgi:polyhydroxyalkanoate synthesis repressor PhaR
MHLIKKYANRKLYHTNQKQYITLDGIARLVQEGESVQILDNETGDDITSSILAQVVLQSRGRSAPQLPTTLLTGMIQLGGDTLANLRRTLFDSLGGAYLIETEIGHRIDTLIGEGKITADEGVNWRQLLLSSEFAKSAQTHLAAQSIDMPSRNDVVQLHSQVDALASIVEQILKKDH